jgi:hypothetical protein
MEDKPMYHDWASVPEGVICVGMSNSASFKYLQNTATQKAVPCIAAATFLTEDDEDKYYFAGVSRTKSICPIADGKGPKYDEFFTLFIGGQCTILNTSNNAVYPGQWLQWTFLEPTNIKNKGCRRVNFTAGGDCSDRKTFGRVITFAEKGKTFDVLL